MYSLAMGRPSLGSAARNVAVTVKMTAAERDLLAARYGSGYKALRALVAAEVGHALRAGGDGRPREKGPRAVEADKVIAEHQAKVDVAVKNLAKTTDTPRSTGGSVEIRHRHRPSKEALDTKYDKGVHLVRYTCIDCGQALPWRTG